MEVSSVMGNATETVFLDDKNLPLALQYGTTTGQKNLVNLIVDMQCALHGLTKHPSWRVSLDAGNTNLIYQAIQTLTDPGDVVLIEVSRCI